MKKILSLLVLTEAMAFCQISQSTYTITTSSVVEIINPFDKLIEWDNRLNSLKAEFSQEVIFKVADMKQSVEGNVVYKKPDSIKITHTKPQSQIIIINSKKEITIVKPKDSQIIKTSWEKWKNNLEPKLKGLFDFGNYQKLGRDSKIETQIIDKENSVVKITSNDSSYTLTLKLNREFFPTECELDLKDTIIKTYIKNAKINEELSKDEFKYKNKNGFEVLKI